MSYEKDKHQPDTKHRSIQVLEIEIGDPDIELLLLIAHRDCLVGEKAEGNEKLVSLQSNMHARTQDEQATRDRE